MTSLIDDKTHQSDLEKVYNIRNCVKSLEEHYQNGIDSEKIEGYEKLIEYQNEFWESHVKCIESCNDNFMTVEEHATPITNKCCKAIWNFCCMVNLYNEMIHADWPTTDVESRKLTILLAICDIENFRCEKKQKCDFNIKKEPSESYHSFNESESNHSCNESDNIALEE